MNIYVSDPNAFIAARNLDDTRLTESLLYSAQIIAAVAFHNKKHSKHFLDFQDVTDPSVRWCLNDTNNFFWLIAHASGLRAEFKERFDFQPPMDGMIWDATQIFGYENPNVKMFQNRTGNFNHILDVPTAYRFHLDKIWEDMVRENKANPRKRLPKWTNSHPPEWYI